MTLRSDAVGQSPQPGGPIKPARIVVTLMALITTFSIACTEQDHPRSGSAPHSSATTTTKLPRCDDPETCTTRQLADAAGITFGTAVDPEHLDEPDYRTTIAKTFNSVTPENQLKWASLHPEPTTWNFGPADQVIDFAQKNGLLVKGHNLIWDQQTIDSTPDWVLAITDPTELRDVVTDHIRTVLRRYRGKVDRWDVVNEPLETVGSAPYDNHFRQVLGDDYVAEMFRIAHDADPDVRLFLNEATVELLPAKAAALIELVQHLIDTKTPIDGVGLQTHLVTGTVDADSYSRLIADLETMGVDVAITELDVPTTPTADASVALDAQADTYAEALNACFEHQCREVTLWGFTDRYTWIDKFLGPGRAPLPFDENYQPKPALDAIRRTVAGIGDSK